MSTDIGKRTCPRRPPPGHRLEIIGEGDPFRSLGCRDRVVGPPEPLQGVGAQALHRRPEALLSLSLQVSLAFGEDRLCGGEITGQQLDVPALHRRRSRVQLVAELGDHLMRLAPLSPRVIELRHHRERERVQEIAERARVSRHRRRGA